jgi:hypothetical protein
VPLGMFFWLFSGILFNLPAIDDNEQSQGEAVEIPKN